MVAAPTTTLEFLIVTLLIDAYEGRDTSTFDVTGAYLQADLADGDNNKRVMLKLIGDFVDIPCDINPEHKKNTVYEKGKKTFTCTF